MFAGSRAMEEAVLLGVPTAASAQLDASFLGGDAVRGLRLAFRAPDEADTHFSPVAVAISSQEVRCSGLAFVL